MFLGRNGAFNQHGINIFYSETQKIVLIEPVRQNGKIARCSMDIPAENIPDVIAAMQSIYDAARTQETPATPQPENPIQEADGSKGLGLKVGSIYRTRDGKKVVLYDYQAAFNFPYLGYIDGLGGRQCECWAKDGSWHIGINDLDIVAKWDDKPEKVPQIENLTPPAPIFRIGQQCVTRDGRIATLNLHDPKNPNYPWRGTIAPSHSTCAWAANGLCFNAEYLTGADLVAEYNPAT